jgi:hypothetical protein
MNNLSRRAYLIACVGAAGLSGCAKQATVATACSDTSALSPVDKQARETLAYADQSPVANQTCQNCSIYIEPSKFGQCGTCQLIKGQINAAGYCTAWAAKNG